MGGQGGGIALIFLVAGLVMVVFGAGAFLTRSYRLLSRQYATSTVNADVAVGEGADPTFHGFFEPADSVRVAFVDALVATLVQAADAGANGREQTEQRSHAPWASVSAVIDRKKRTNVSDFSSALAFIVREVPLKELVVFAAEVTSNRELGPC